MSIAPTKIADLKYGALYLPSLIYAYLVFRPVPPTFELLGATLPHPNLYPWATILTLFLAVYIHNVGIAIFGHGGPPKNPKLTNIVLFHLIELIWPVPLDDWKMERFESNREMLQELADSLEGRSWWRDVILATTFTLFLLAGYLLFYYSIFPLTYYILYGSADLVGGLLWLGLAIFYIDGHISESFPPVGDSDAAAKLNQAEYKYFQELVDEMHSYDGADQAQTLIDENWSEQREKS